MNEITALKFEVIADIQQEVNRQVLEWCQQSDFLVEKRSAIHHYSKIFKDREGKRFTLPQQQIIYDNIFSYYLDDYNPIHEFHAHRDVFIARMTSVIMSALRNHVILQRQSMKTVGEVNVFEEAIKVIFYGLVPLDKDTLQLQFGISDILDGVNTLDYI